MRQGGMRQAEKARWLRIDPVLGAGATADKKIEYNLGFDFKPRVAFACEKAFSHTRDPLKHNSGNQPNKKATS